MKFKLFYKIGIILAALAMLPAIIVSWRTVEVNRQYLETNILELHIELAHALAMQINTTLKTLEETIQNAALFFQMQGFVSPQALDALRKTKSELKYIGYFSQEGKIFIASGELNIPEIQSKKSLAKFSLFEQYRKTEFLPIQPKFYFHYEKDRPYLWALFPMAGMHPERGGFFVVLELQELWDQIASDGAGIQSSGREVFIVDESGRILAAPNSSDWTTGQSIAENPIIKEALKQQTLGSKEYVDARGESVVGAYDWVMRTGWITIIQSPKRVAYNAITSARNQALRITLIAVLLSTIIAFLLTRSILRPVLLLIDAARHISRGEFQTRVDIRTHDEMETLAQTFNEMTQDLERYNAMQLAQILEQKNKTDAVVFSITDGIALLSAGGSVELANRVAVKLFNAGRAREEELSIEDPPATVLEWARDPELNNVAAEILIAPEEPQIKEISLMIDGAATVWQISWRPVFLDAAQKRKATLVLFHDVTSERSMEALRETFFHTITHDLRNPLSSIMGFLKLFAEDLDPILPPPYKKILKTMQRASIRMLGMINDILDSAKIEAQMLEAQKTRIDFTHLAQECVQLYEPLAHRKEITLSLASAKENLMVEADPEQMERVLSNLIGNALKFTPSKGKILVKVEEELDRISVTVEDSGPGIAAEYLEKVFDKFQQVKDSRQKGTGLGLTICKYFVGLHGGKIWVESTPPNGAQFHFWIPKGNI